ncbi:MAG: hypothetical protein P1V20_14940 [Verrucomicrobiales bacterium]|nr:hypothetical protein [Verrucomicrobiales bacterium]
MMERKRHWTVYVITGIALLCAGSFLWRGYSTQMDLRFEKAINEAGGAVHYEGIEFFTWSTPGGMTSFTLGDYHPVAVEISSGSHPVPEALKELQKRKSIRILSLNTNQTGDHLVPLISTFRYIEELDLCSSEISGAGIISILDALPGLTEFRISEENYTADEMATLRRHPGFFRLKLE